MKNPEWRPDHRAARARLEKIVAFCDACAVNPYVKEKFVRQMFANVAQAVNQVVKNDLTDPGIVEVDDLLVDLGPKAHATRK